MSNSIVTLEIGGQTLHCHGTAQLGEPAQTWGPPEHCDPGSPDEWDLESVWLEVEVSDDLSPNARAMRTVEIDVTALFTELDGGKGALWNELDRRVWAKFDWDSLADPGDDREDDE
ncbi:MAG: hypothetical protein LLG08_03895 [Actinomycetia bacterium]|nr:hypothetical protein [Actinomycetes bacterium]